MHSWVSRSHHEDALPSLWDRRLGHGIHGFINSTNSEWVAVGWSFRKDRHQEHDLWMQIMNDLPPPLSQAV